MIQITSVRHNWPNPPGYRMKRTKGHPDYTFVHFTTSIELTLNGEELTVPEHTCILYRPGTPQLFSCPHGMIHDWFHFTNASPLLFEKLNIPLDTLLFPKQWFFITDLVEEIENEFFAQKENGEYLIDLKVKELLVRLGRALNSRLAEPTDPKLTADLRQLRKKITQGLSHHWTVAEMANELLLSQSRFAHLYHSFYGTTPVDDLIRMRIHAAQNALMFTENTISEISDSLGYRNTTHFCRQFRKITGTTPSQYRKESH